MGSPNRYLPPTSFPPYFWLTRFISSRFSLACSIWSILAFFCRYSELLCRPELSYELLNEIDPDRQPLSDDVIEQVNINIKYDGYIKRQIKQVETFRKIENKKIPKDIDYDDVSSLRLEARAKLKSFQPVSVGQASRISGVSPADISVLLIYLETYYQKT